MDIKADAKNRRHRGDSYYMNRDMQNIAENVSAAAKDSSLVGSLYFSPTVLSHIRRVFEEGGKVITDTTLIFNEIDASLFAGQKARLVCYLDDPYVDETASLRHITRAEVAVDYALNQPGPKLFVIGSAPASIGKILKRKRQEPMNDVCVLAAPAGFAGVVQLKETLVESNISSVVLRGKKGGVVITAQILNEVLKHCLPTSLATVKAESAE